MKRWFSVLFVLMLCLSLLGCGKQPAETPPVDVPPAVETPPVETPAPPTQVSPSQQPVTPPEEPVPTDPLPGEQVAPEVPAFTHSNTMFTFADDAQEPLLILTSSIPVFEGMSKINDYYQIIYDDLYAICQLSVEDAARQKTEAQAMGQEFTPWSVRLLPLVTRNDGVTLSLQHAVIEKRGEQESSQTYGETFDAASQGRLVLGNLFQPESDYLSRLPVTEPDQLNFSLTDGFLLLFTESESVSVPLSDLSDILKPQYLTE